MNIRLPNQSVLYLTELLQLVNDEPIVENQQALLRLYFDKDNISRTVMTQFVELYVHPMIVWQLPLGTPKYTPSSGHIGESPNSLFKAFREVNRFLEGGINLLQNPTKRQLYFVQLLEGLASEEAQLLIQLKDKNLTSYPNISVYLIATTFADLLPEEVVEAAINDEKKSENTNQETGSQEVESTPVVSSARRGRPAKNTAK